MKHETSNCPRPYGKRSGRRKVRLPSSERAGCSIIGPLSPGPRGARGCCREPALREKPLCLWPVTWYDGAESIRKRANATDAMS